MKARAHDTLFFFTAKTYLMSEKCALYSCLILNYANENKFTTGWSKHAEKTGCSCVSVKES